MLSCCEFAGATHRPGLEVYDWVGCGNSFASGLIYGLMTLQPHKPRNIIR